ncbi:hypothetical protein [Streptomyces sp. HGB0020]|jgi:hypothetical protein|uniref:hypothetical protein n=1 Tax=Streptomyces sp. HGB0020 TaxID=1078086 RepID=UPI00034ECBB4|nr:hypothetical protein [Streptomyces sp. HGB0020]EPD56381.1 hypothetical protein HMPREF1211_07501 [Streptomyces sp. HGB0020]
MVHVLNLIPAEPGWVATVHYYSPDDEGRRHVTAVERRTVHGWALVDADGVSTIEPMYVEPGGFPTCQSLYNSYASDDLVDVRVHYDLDATNVNDPRLSR